MIFHHCLNLAGIFFMRKLNQTQTGNMTYLGLLLYLGSPKHTVKGNQIALESKNKLYF